GEQAYGALAVRQNGVTRDKPKRIVEQKERARYGLAPSEKEHKLWTRDLVSVVQDYISDLHAAGRDIKYVSNVRSRISILMRSLGWRALNQVSAEDFQRWRAAQSKAPKTLNEYLDAISGLWNWLRQRSATFPENPFRGVKRCETRGKEERVRRAFTVEELKRLLAVAREGRAVYLMAATTGIRRAELEALTWSDLALDVPIPYVLVRASTSKNKNDKALPLHADTISALQE